MNIEINLEDLKEMYQYHRAIDYIWKESDICFLEKQVTCIGYVGHIEQKGTFKNLPMEQVKEDIRALTEDKAYVLEAIHEIYKLVLEESFKIASLHYRLQEQKAD